MSNNDNTARVVSFDPAQMVRRDIVFELSQYKRPAAKRDRHIGARTFPAYLGRWVQDLGLSTTEETSFADSAAFCQFKGAELLSKLPGIDVIRDARPIILRLGTADEQRWLRTFDFEMAANAEGRERRDFYLAPEEDAPGHALKLLLGVNKDRVAELAMAMILLYVPTVAGDAKELMLADLRRFRRAVEERAEKADKLRLLALSRPVIRGFSAGLDDVLEEQ